MWRAQLTPRSVILRAFTVRLLVHFELLHTTGMGTGYNGRDAAGFSNPIGLAVMWWALSAPLVVIGLTEVPNSGWAKAHPAHLPAASLNGQYIS